VLAFAVLKVICNIALYPYVHTLTAHGPTRKYYVLETLIVMLDPIGGRGGRTYTRIDMSLHYSCCVSCVQDLMMD